MLFTAIWSGKWLGRRTYMKRRTRAITLCGVCILAFALGAAISEARHERPPSFKLIPLESMLKYCYGLEPVAVDLYYLDWSAHTIAPVREEELTRYHHVRIQDRRLRHTHRDVLSILKNTPLKKKSPGFDSLNFRYSCIFHTHNGEATQVSLALGVPVVLTVNGEQFEAPPKLIDSLIRLLPVKDYILIRKDLEKYDFFETGPILDDLQNPQAAPPK